MKPNVEIQELKLGDGIAVERGFAVVVRYIGRLRRGDVFASWEAYGQPARFVIGQRRIVAGLEYGIVGMRVGGARRITVPPHLGYREKGLADIVPPNAIMIFDVELLEAHAPK
ncbi:MAG: FKBP-type peptidyl-prolyl cis-trans isomerase [Alphaproteobacteria bacterium]